MSTSDYIYPIIAPYDVDVKDAFSSTNTPDYTPASPDYSSASPGNTSLNPSDDLSKSIEGSRKCVFSLVVWEIKASCASGKEITVMQAYNATSNESPIPPPRAPIAPPTVLPPSPVLERVLIRRIWSAIRNRSSTILKSHRNSLLSALRHGNTKDGHGKWGMMTRFVLARCQDFYLEIHMRKSRVRHRSDKELLDKIRELKELKVTMALLPPGYGPENNKQESNIVCDKKSDDSKENSDNSLVKEQVSKDTSSFIESSLNVDKETVFLVDKKVESVNPSTSEEYWMLTVKDDGSPKVSNSSPLVSLTATINMPRGLCNVDVAATFRVSLTIVGDLHLLIKSIDAGKHNELLSGMTNDEHDSTNLDIDESTIPNDPIVQSVDINTKSISYVGAASASAKDQPKVNSNFRHLVTDPVFDGVNIFIPHKVVEKVDPVDVVTIVIPSLTGDDFIKETIRIEYEWRPPRCDICKIFFHVHDYYPKKVVSPSIIATSNFVTPTVEKINDGFQTVGKKRRGKENPSLLMLTTGYSSKNDNIITSNSYSTLNEEEDKEEDIENVYDETANLFPNTKTGESSSFTAAAGALVLDVYQAVLLEVNVIEHPKSKIPVTWSKNNNVGIEKNTSTVDENEGCSLQEKQENFTSEVVAASTSTMDVSNDDTAVAQRRLEDKQPEEKQTRTAWDGDLKKSSASTLAASTSTVWDEDRRLIEIVSLAIHEGNRLRPEEMVNGLGLHSLSSTSKMAASTSTMADVKKEIKRWSFLEEISKPFDDSLKTRFSELEEDVVFSSSTKKEHGDYTCQNVLSIWPKLREERKKRRGPRDVGNRENIKEPRDEIKNNLPKSDVIMIEEGTSIHDFGFITFSLSREWMAKSIHKMIKDGIDTWAPRLPVERVVVDYPSLDEEILVDLFRRRAIGHTLIRMLEYSKVVATIGPTQDILGTDEIYHWAREILNKWFSKRKRKGKVVIKGKLPFMLAKRDFDNAYKDLLALWYGHCVHQADWIVNVTPVRQQEYIKMCFTAAELEKWIPTDRHEPPRTSYAGYRTCTTEVSDNLLDEAKTRCKVMEQGDAAKLLGYTAEVVLDCAFTYTYLKNHRLAVWKFDIDEMFHEEGNTFVYLLNTQARLRRITNDSRKDIEKLKKAELILEENEKWKEGEERILEFHLLNFTQTSSFFDLSLTQLPPGLLFSASQPMDISARDPPRNSRFELFSIFPSVITDTVKEGKLFGLIAVSDNYGILSDDGGFYLDEPDYAYLSSFSSSIDIHMRLFVTATNKKKKNKDKFFQLYCWKT
ncbi:arginine--tRNA ligase, chloroplastic/mitochondrial [Tanacetum coccineum]